MSKKRSKVDRIDVRLFKLAEQRSKEQDIPRVEVYREISSLIKSDYPEFDTDELIAKKKRRQDAFFPI